MASDPLRRLTEDLEDVEVHLQELPSAQVEAVVVQLLRVLKRWSETPAAQTELATSQPDALTYAKLAEGRLEVRQKPDASARTHVFIDSTLVAAVQERFGRPPISKRELVELALNDLLERIGWPEGSKNGSEQPQPNGDPATKERRVFASTQAFLDALEAT